MSHPLSRNSCKPVVGQKFTVGAEDYLVAGKLGNGAVGLVRTARRQRDGKRFAMKLLAPDPKYIDVDAFDDVAARFKREGQRGTQLEHPGLVAIKAYVENVGGEAFALRRPINPFIIMECVRGTTLESYIRKEERRSLEKKERRSFLVTPERLSIAINVVKALQYLHQRKLVHRDVKPANVFLPPTTDAARRRAKLGDFGIMKWGDFQAKISSGTLTVTTQRGLGTLKYMSPEQAITPKEVTVRSDVFSLGITLFELFTGQILTSPHHVFEVIHARQARGNAMSRYMSMGLSLSSDDARMAELVMDMHLRGASGRPPIDKVAGSLVWEWEQRMEMEWA